MNKSEEQIRKKSPVQIKNKKASFEYFFIETFTAGIVLTGTEIKSIRLGKASLVDTYCTVINGELWVKGMSISPYFYGSYNNHADSWRVPRNRLVIPSCRCWCLSMRKDVRRWISPYVKVRRSLTSVRR